MILVWNKWGVAEHRIAAILFKILFLHFHVQTSRQLRTTFDELWFKDCILKFDLFLKNNKMEHN